MKMPTTLEQRVFSLLLAAETLRASGQVEAETARLLADAIEAHLFDGEPLDRALGIRAPRGSHRTARSVAAVIADEGP